MIGFSENHTKFKKIFLMVLTNQLIYLVNFNTISPNFNCTYVVYLFSKKIKIGNLLGEK